MLVNRTLLNDVEFELEEKDEVLDKANYFLTELTDSIPQAHRTFNRKRGVWTVSASYAGVFEQLRSHYYGAPVALAMEA